MLFSVSTVQDEISYATEAKISSISNPHEYSSDFSDILLHNYFLKPRYLRCQDIFNVPVKDYCPDSFFSVIDPQLNFMYYKVRSIKSKDIEGDYNGFYVMYAETMLIQENSIYSYLPKIISCKVPEILLGTNSNLIDNYLEHPPSLEDPLRQVDACISPFLKRG